MAQQHSIQTFFSKKKCSATQRAFQQQLNGINIAEKNKSEIESQGCCDHIKEIDRMKKVEVDLRRDVELIENKAKTFEIQCEEQKKKYDKLKIKHIQLLQVLLEKESVIRKLSKSLRPDQNENETEQEVDDQNPNDREVSFTFCGLNHFVYSISCNRVAITISECNLNTDD